MIKSAEYLVTFSSILGSRAGISKFAIGLTIVAIGTSLPELFTAIFGLYSSNGSSFVFGTVIGSNIVNTLFIFGLLLIFSKNFKSKIKKIDIFFLLGATLLLTLIIVKSNLNIFDSLILLALFATYIYITIKKSKKEMFEEEIKGAKDKIFAKKSNYLLSIFLILSIAGLNIAAKGVIYSIENIGLILKIPLEMLTLTTVAFATSLPEAIVTYAVAKKKEFDIIIGDIIGSNISNILLIIGVSGLIKNLIFETSLYIPSIFILIIATLIFYFLINKKNVSKIHGIVFLALYVLYIAYTFTP